MPRDTVEFSTLRVKGRPTPRPSPATLAPQTPTPGAGWAMVRGVALMVMAALLTGLVQMVQYLLLERTGMARWMDGLVLWTVLLAALILLSGPSVRLAHGLLAWLDRLALRTARQRWQGRALS